MSSSSSSQRRRQSQEDEIQMLRKRLEQLERDTSGHSSTASEHDDDDELSRHGRTSTMETDTTDHSELPRRKKAVLARKQQQPPPTSPNGNAFAHLSKSTRNLGQRPSILSTESQFHPSSSYSNHSHTASPAASVEGIFGGSGSELSDAIGSSEEEEEDDAWLTLGQIQSERHQEGIRHEEQQFFSFQQQQLLQQQQQKQYQMQQKQQQVQIPYKQQQQQKETVNMNETSQAAQSSRAVEPAVREPTDQVLDNETSTSSQKYEVARANNNWSSTSSEYRQSDRGDDPVVITNPVRQGSLTYGSRQNSYRHIKAIGIEEILQHQQTQPSQLQQIQPLASPSSDQGGEAGDSSVVYEIRSRKSALLTASHSSSSASSLSWDDEREAMKDVAAPIPLPLLSHEIPKLSQSSGRREFSDSFSRVNRRSSFTCAIPVGISKDGSPQVPDHAPPLVEGDKGPSFTQFALLALHPMTVSRLGDEQLFVDDGPRFLDAFCLTEVDFLDTYPREAAEDVIEPQALSCFCFPDGLRVRFVPRVALAAANRLGWLGQGADRHHVLVFTNGAGKATHGVAITIRHEMILTQAERSGLHPILQRRWRRRKAATNIARWWKNCVQERILNEALMISGFESHSAADFKAELAPQELRLLEKSLRRITMSGRDLFETQDKRQGQSHGKSSAVLQRHMKKQGINKKLKKVLSRGRGRELTLQNTPSSHQLEDTSEVEKLTRNAVMRSVLSPVTVSGDTGSVITDEMDILEESAGSVDKKKSRMFRISDRGSSRVSLRSKMSSTPSGITNTSTRSQRRRTVSRWARERGLESFEAMKEADKHGYVCLVEKCYVLIGCLPDEHTLLLGPLKLLVNSERDEMAKFRVFAESRRRRSSEVDIAEEADILSNQLTQRHTVMEAMSEKLRLTTVQALISYPRSQLEHVRRKPQYFEADLPIPNATPFKLPLPLPKIGQQWALARLLLDVGPDSLVLLLKLMLMERSILVLGEYLEEVTACACALLELLKPFEWASVFMPVLPRKMLDFVNSPVPFVAGMAVNDFARVCDVENDERTLDAMAHGMSLLNLSTNTLHITSEARVSKMLSLDPYLREQLGYLRSRLQHFAKDPLSPIRSFENFIQTGLSPNESLTLHSVCNALEGHFTRFCGDLTVSGNAWKRYGTIHMETGKFAFYPEWFMNPLRADQAFHEAMVRTQLFLGYVDERRNDQMEVDQLKRGELGRFIADWIYRRWVVRKRRNK